MPGSERTGERRIGGFGLLQFGVSSGGTSMTVWSIAAAAGSSALHLLDRVVAAGHDDAQATSSAASVMRS